MYGASQKRSSFVDCILLPQSCEGTLCCTWPFPSLYSPISDGIHARGTVIYTVIVVLKSIQPRQGNVDVVVVVTVEVRVDVDCSVVPTVLVVVVVVNPPTTAVLVVVVVLDGRVTVPPARVTKVVEIEVLVAVTVCVDPGCDVTKQLHALLARSRTTDRSTGGQFGTTSPRTLGAARFPKVVTVLVIVKLRAPSSMAIGTCREVESLRRCCGTGNCRAQRCCR